MGKIPEQEGPNDPGRRKFIVGGLALLALTAASCTAKRLGFNPDILAATPEPHTPTPYPTATPEATSTPSSTPSPTPTETPKPTSTPEAPKLEKVVYWTDEQILKAQEEALAKGKILLLESALGGKIVGAKTGYGIPGLGVIIEAGETISSPIKAKNSSSYILVGPGFRLRNLRIEIDDRYELSIFVNEGVDILTKGGPLDLNTPLLKFNNNNPIPAPDGSKDSNFNSFIDLVDKQTNKAISLTEADNTLRDGNGTTVKSLSQAK